MGWGVFTSIYACSNGVIVGIHNDSNLCGTGFASADQGDVLAAVGATDCLFDLVGHRQDDVVELVGAVQRDGGYRVPSCVQQRLELRWGGRPSRREVGSLLGAKGGVAPPDCTGDQNPTCCCGERMEQASDPRPSTA
jgi:hypothetical protein